MTLIIPVIITFALLIGILGGDMVLEAFIHWRGRRVDIEDCFWVRTLSLFLIPITWVAYLGIMYVLR